jgi:glycosyltransferase involved in cell wall biosynthesis
MARTLNECGIETYYISLSGKVSGHDSTAFHYGSGQEHWNLSPLFDGFPNLSHKADQILYLPAKAVKQLREIKHQYGISHCLATGIKAYLLHRAGIPYRYWSYGSDLDRHCFRPVFPPKYPLWIRGPMYFPFMLRIRPNARKSIRYSSSVMIAPYQLDSLNRICEAKDLFFLPHLIKILDYDLLAQEREKSKRRICREISAEHFFFSATRHEWSGPFKDQPDNKGNDIIIKTFEKYLSMTKDYGAKLVLVEKGSDIEASKALVRKLGISQNVLWMGQRSRNEIQQFYQGATLCFGQFGTPVITYAVLEPLANGNICATYYGEQPGEVPFYDQLPPLCNSRDPEELVRFMVEILSHENRYQELCYQSWKWIRDHCSVESFVRSFSETFLDHGS